MEAIKCLFSFTFGGKGNATVWEIPVAPGLGRM